VQEQPTPEKKKLGRQLSVASHGNHYADPNLAETERALNGRGGVASPTNSQKESFFSHLRKRARRFSGRNQLPNTPKYEDPEPTAGCGPWAASTRSSMILDPKVVADALPKGDFTELDKALQNVKYSLDATTNGSPLQSHPARHTPTDPAAVSAALKRHHSMVHVPSTLATDSTSPAGLGPISSRTRRALHLSSYPAYRYETPDEEEELLDEALKSASHAVYGLENPQKTHVSRDALTVKDSNRQALQHSVSVGQLGEAYPTPSPSAKRNGILFQQNLMDEPTTPLNIARSRPTKETYAPMFPTPPYEENEWAAAALASTFAAGSAYRY
jgi:meiosis induction protein kinase IME2/SME1